MTNKMSILNKNKSSQVEVVVVAVDVLEEDIVILHYQHIDKHV
jgi:hypothetical protein